MAKDEEVESNTTITTIRCTRKGGEGVAEWQRSTPISQNRIIIIVSFSDHHGVF